MSPVGLAGWIIRFSAFLKNRGFRVFQTSVYDALCGLRETGLARREDFLAVLRANLATNQLEWTQFHELFNEFWTQTVEEEPPKREWGRPERKGEKDGPDQTSSAEFVVEESLQGEPSPEREVLEQVCYSPLTLLQKKDVARFDQADLMSAQLALKRLMEPFRLQSTRRSKRSKKRAELDFPRIMKKSLKREGIPLELFYKEKKKRLKRLVVLADVSGSMDRYARFVMPFLLGLRRVGPRAEVFVFSTSLTRITHTIRHLSIQKVLERIPEEVPHWSGGTRIGYSLHQFNQLQGEKLLGRNTVVVIMSDGWDLGAKSFLSREMEILSRKAYCVIWLNPLAGDPGYQPICQGMQVALPYVDYFLPANNLENLKRVGRVLSKIMVH